MSLTKSDYLEAMRDLGKMNDEDKFEFIANNIDYFAEDSYGLFLMLDNDMTFIMYWDEDSEETIIKLNVNQNPVKKTNLLILLSGQNW